MGDITVYCESTMCKWNDHGECTQEMICLVHRMTGGGLILMCEQDTDN